MNSESTELYITLILLCRAINIFAVVFVVNLMSSLQW